MIRMLIAIAIATLLTACSSVIPKDSSIRMGSVQNDNQNDGALDKLADKILQADTIDGRKLRICFFSMAVGEAYRFRLDYYGGAVEQKQQAYASLLSMQAALRRLKEKGSGLFPRTDMFYASIGLIRAVEGPARDRALGLIGTAVTLDWRGMARALREGVGQGWLISAMIDDAKDAADKYDRKELTLAEAWTACENRMQTNIEGLAMAIGIGDPEQLRIVPGGAIPASGATS